MICFSSLEVFEAQENKIDDLIELEMCSTLKWLNLKNNAIKEEDNILFLSSLIDLKYLNLNGNPIQVNENYKNLINNNLTFIDKIDLEEIESPKINGKVKNNLLLASKEIENSLDITNGSKDTNNQSKINSTINFSDGNMSLRPPSSNTLSDFYKKDNNNYIPFNCKNSILDPNQMTKTAMNWKHNNNMEDEVNTFNLDSNKKVLQGIKSILSQNRKCLDDISIFDNNEKENSINTKLENSIHIKGFPEASMVYSSKGSGLNHLKPIINVNRNYNADEKKPVLIKKPIVIKTAQNLPQKDIGDKSNNNFNFSDATLINDFNLNNTSSSLIKFKNESQTPLKPIVFKKIDKLPNDSNIEANNRLNNNEKVATSFISNGENKIIFKNKPVIIKKHNTNTSLIEETNSPKKFINPALIKVKSFLYKIYVIIYVVI